MSTERSRPRDQNPRAAEEQHNVQAHSTELTLDASPDVWAAYAAGHADGAAEASLLADAAARGAYSAGFADGKRSADTEYQARPVDRRAVASFLEYLAHDPDVTPRPIPGLDHGRGRTA